jgi:cyclic pyranopterin phosphate synthase
MVALPILNMRPHESAAAPPRSVRISITDRCDLACVYCRPSRSEHYMESRMSLAEFETMLAGLRASGIERVRITGGEPLVHPDPTAFIRAVAAAGFSDVALTTNATRLAELARPLRAAGLSRINVSIDSLDEARFFRLTRGGSLARVLDGIEAALAAGFDEVKTNTVVVKDENEDELGALAEWAWSRGMTPRFLELMAIGEGAKMKDRVVSYAEMRARLAHLLDDGDVPTRDTDRGPAKYVVSRHDPKKRAGFITGTTDTYCKGCDRLRVSADGVLRPCLAKEDGVSARAAANHDADAVAREVTRAWSMKPDGETFRGCTEDSAASVSIRKIGG